MSDVENKRNIVIWFTGLPSSGKTTLSLQLAEELKQKGLNISLLDGDELRKSISADLGFSAQDRKENVRRAAAAAKQLAASHDMVVVALVSPFAEDRAMARKLIGENFVEVFVDCPMAVCEQRDVKKLYRKARAGELKEMTGIDSPYERPHDPDVVLRTDLKSISECIELLLSSPKLQNVL